MLIADALPLVSRYPDRPLAYNVVWKTAIYFVAATFTHYLERLYEFWKNAGVLIAGNQKLLSAIVWSHCLVTAILLLVILFMYCTMREWIRVIGREKVWAMFFGPPPKDQSSG